MKKIILLCIFISFYTHSESYINLLNSVNYVTNGYDSLHYPTNFNTIILDSNNSKFNKIVYLLNKRNKIIEINLNENTISGNQSLIQTTGDLQYYLTGNKISGVNGGWVDHAIHLIESRFNLPIKNLTHKDTSQLLESKSNTCQAMLTIRNKYQHDKKMLEYIDLFFPETGFINSLDDIETLMTSKKDKGFVIKYDRGDSTMNVLVLPPEKLQNYKTAEDILFAVANRYASITSMDEAFRALSDQTLIWQEYIETHDKEMGFLYYITKDNQLAFGGLSTDSMKDSYWKASHAAPKSHIALFNAIDDEAFSYFDTLINELINTKINLHAGYSNGLQDKNINLKIFGVDILPKQKGGKIIPVVSELNPRFTGNSYPVHSFLNYEASNTINDNQLFTWLISNDITLDEDMNAETIVSEILSAYEMTFDSEADPFELGRLILGGGETYLKLFLSFPTLNKVKLDGYLKAMEQFSITLQERLTLRSKT